ncbi:MAG: sulfurtransferase TusA family protein [Clostridia bacterium]|nr:sulfurtransferase TusA family protein [Clostridia bacterium]
MAEKTVDTRGLSCPEPVLLTKKALADGGEGLVILIDNSTAFGNVQRFLKKSGKEYSAQENGGEFVIQVK